MACSRPSPSHAASRLAAGPFPNELLLDGANFPAIVYWRPPIGTNPTVIFLPGGGHLARVAYGHPGAHAPDFLDFWLREAGWGLLAISYPSDHSAFPKAYPDMTVSNWGASVADIAVGLLAGCVAPCRIVVAGWSMAGRAARSACNELTRVGFPPIGFISLAASAPFPGLVPVLEKGEPLTQEGLWDLAASEFGLPSREIRWCAELAVQSAENGREVIPVEIYRRDYRVNTPLLLRAEPQFVRTSGAVRSFAEVAQELGTFDYASHPLTGVIAPTKPSDARHALTDALTWGFLNAQQLFEHLVKGGRDLCTISPERWERLRLLMMDLPQRLTRTVAGGHFFFIGALGAEAAARHLIDLSRDIASLQAEISVLISEAPQLSSPAPDQ